MFYYGNLTKIKVSTYKLVTGTTTDNVSKQYLVSKDIDSDKPSGEIKGVFANFTGYDGWGNDAGVTCGVNYDHHNAYWLWVGSNYASVGINVVVIWLYK